MINIIVKREEIRLPEVVCPHCKDTNDIEPRKSWILVSPKSKDKDTKISLYDCPTCHKSFRKGSPVPKEN